MSEPSERDLNRDAADKLWNGDDLIRWSTIYEAIAVARTEGDQAGYERGRREAARLFDAIAHGDEAHRAWLKQAIEDHFAGRPVQKPAGEGGYQRGRREAIEECADIIEAAGLMRSAKAIRALAKSTTWPARERASLGRESK